ncbi:MAG: AMP-binding protein, partial [Nakamurella sp.]
MSFRSPLADVAIPDMTLFDYLFGDIDAVADQPALIDGPSGAVTTYRGLVGRISALAGGLAQRGFHEGHVAAILCPNAPVFVTVFHGILRAGGTATTINSLYTVDDITGQLADSAATYLFTISLFLPQAAAAAERVGLPAANIVVIDESDPVACGRTSLRQL